MVLIDKAFKRWNFTADKDAAKDIDSRMIQLDSLAIYSLIRLWFSKNLTIALRI